MKNLFKFFLILFLMVSPAVLPANAQSQHTHWEPVKTMGQNLKCVMNHDDISVFSAPSLITVSVNQQVNIQIFTILGKLVSSQTLEPGIYEFRLNPHGIYIVKTTETTCKVAI